MGAIPVGMQPLPADYAVYDTVSNDWTLPNGVVGNGQVSLMAHFNKRLKHRQDIREKQLDRLEIKEEARRAKRRVSVVEALSSLAEKEDEDGVI